MKLNKYLTNCKSVVINLKERTDKRDYIKKHLKKEDIEYEFYFADKNSNPKRGCLESHLTIIKNTISNNLTLDDKNKIKYLFIMEDDCKFINSIKSMKEPPKNWDMLYLGGTVHRILDKKHMGFARVQCWTTHAYIINLTNQNLISKIMELESYPDEIDRFYLESIHPNFNVYVCDPMIAIQKEGYSDIENREVSYDFMQYTLKGLRSPDYTIDKDGNYVLKLQNIKDEDLPAITIITPTYKRRKIFSMALRNFDNFIYPKNKLEWVIVDDSPETETEDHTVRDLLPRDKRIKYIHLDSPEDEPLTVAMKRNIAVSNSTNNYIIHMDDDDYYPPESILARIKILLKYRNEGIECVGSTLIGTYNIINNSSSMSTDGPISLSEASMAYTKKFWEERPFDELCERGEHKHFCEQRLDRIVDIPYSFILIAVNHRDNLTEHLRTDKSGLLKFSDNSDKAGEVANFFDTWDLDTQLFIIELQRYLTK
jgi:GR25 family glycosyltransferase involved in LPS biosynthesis